MSIERIGVVGMGAMGRNLALNLERNGCAVSVCNRSPRRTDDLLRAHRGKRLLPCASLDALVSSLDRPRRIFLMIAPGPGVDSVIRRVRPQLNREDVLIDGGNSFYKDTARRQKALWSDGIHLIGAGVSGGTQGARTGASIMPGGHRDAYDTMEPIFKRVAARVGRAACVSYIGPDGSGHFVKMVHNGIEYGLMQLISEVYALLKAGLRCGNEQLSEIFARWNRRSARSYLLSITHDILLKKDKDGRPLLDKISDQAANKGTGVWAGQTALRLGEPMDLVTTSVFARHLSALKQQRSTAAQTLQGPERPSIGCAERFVRRLERSLRVGMIVSHAQGFALLRTASRRYRWNLNCAEIANVFRSGCIIQSDLVRTIASIYAASPDTQNLLLSSKLSKIVNRCQSSTRKVVQYAVRSGVFIPGLASVLSYLDGYRSRLLPSNLIQAQRDFFGAHRYRREDTEGTFHTEWCR